MDTNVEVFQVGVVPGILNLEKTFQLIQTYMTFVTPSFEDIFREHLTFSFLNTPLKMRQLTWIPTKLNFQATFLLRNIKMYTFSNA